MLSSLANPARFMRIMAVGFTLLFGWLLLRMRTALNERKARALRLYGCPQSVARRAGSRFPPPGRLGAEIMTGGLAAYFAMGGYAAFVWPAYGIAAAVLAIHSWHRYRASRDALDCLQPTAGNRE